MCGYGNLIAMVVFILLDYYWTVEHKNAYK